MKVSLPFGHVTKAMMGEDGLEVVVKITEPYMFSRAEQELIAAKLAMLSSATPRSLWAMKYTKPLGEWPYGTVLASKTRVRGSPTVAMYVGKTGQFEHNAVVVSTPFAGLGIDVGDMLNINPDDWEPA